jgi:hypothetical protein
MRFDDDHLDTLMPFGAPSTSSSTDGLANGSDRPLLPFLIDAGAEGMRKERSSRPATVCFAKIWRKHLSGRRRVETATGARRNLMTLPERSARAAFSASGRSKAKTFLQQAAQGRAFLELAGAFGTEVISMTVRISN